jgi:hypothetical protein
MSVPAPTSMPPINNLCIYCKTNNKWSSCTTQSKFPPCNCIDCIKRDRWLHRITNVLFPYCSLECQMAWVKYPKPGQPLCQMCDYGAWMSRDSLPYEYLPGCHLHYAQAIALKFTNPRFTVAKIIL